ncbi:hypothetical protein HPDFL43_00023710 [Hoeflea phototrophica DFL-43]|uniref:Uncharacterized protein n=1 Tax=Hoeflea phototrophica (strain DSM 17068 / NCIMB 14078 / DFL-43) TaxID=411684 RepID=A0A095BE52_HOEPD|nr:hypothetical protein HPDFL43_00023710 [Hoeflea phototrophica DFL-43]
MPAGALAEELRALPGNGHGEPSRAAIAGMCCAMNSGGPRTGCAVRKLGFGVCMLVEHARGWRNLRTARNSPDDVRIRQTETGSCNSPDRGRHAHLEPRSGTHTGLRCRCGGAGAQISTNPASESRSATGPFPPPARLPAGANRHRGQGLLRWLAWPANATKRQQAANGNAVVSTSPPALPHVTPTPQGPSSRLARSVHDPSGSGSMQSVTRGLEGGEEMGAILQ